MKKLAVFVEGYTEQEFIERFLIEIVGIKQLVISKHEISGGKKPGTRRMSRISIPAPLPTDGYFVMLVNCGNDERVKSDIKDQYPSLAAAGYSTIIGIRDVYPSASLVGIAALRTGLAYGMPTVPIEVCFILGIMEIESWFLSEFTHFQRLDSVLTPELIDETLGFNPRVDDMQMRDRPALDLDASYQIVGLNYAKSQLEIERTLNALDFAHLYLGMQGRLPDLARFRDTIDRFLTP